MSPAQITITIILKRKSSTPRKAGGTPPIGGEGSILSTLGGAAMYVADPNHNTRTIIAKIAETLCMPVRLFFSRYLNSFSTDYSGRRLLFPRSENQFGVFRRVS